MIETSSAEEALRAMRADARFDVLISDHLTPGMSGAELARAVQEARPGTPVLIASGYAENDGIQPALARLTKPFRRNELASAIVAADRRESEAAR